MINRALLLLLFLQGESVMGQVYVDGTKNRYRFAQTAVGFDLRTTLPSGNFHSTQQRHSIENKFQADITPILTLAGTHFWGHMEFFTGFALFSHQLTTSKEKYYFKRNAGTGFKVYPFKLKFHRLVPYLGTSFGSFTFKTEQSNKLTRLEYPVLIGISYLTRKGLIEVGGNYYFKNQHEYYLNEAQKAHLHLPRFNFSVKYKFFVDFTVLSEQREERGDILNSYNKLLSGGGMNTFFVSSGFSNSYIISRSSYNQSKPYLDDYRISAIAPEFSLGYHHHKVDGNVFLEFRNFRYSLKSAFETQRSQRQSWNLGLSKYLGDYHGFNPFVGASLSMEKIKIEEIRDGGRTELTDHRFLSYGLFFGWDIKPTLVDWWTIRSQVRYFPSLNAPLTPQSGFNFAQLEVNFFQFVFMINRFAKLQQE